MIHIQKQMFKKHKKQSKESQKKNKTKTIGTVQITSTLEEQPEGEVQLTDADRIKLQSMIDYITLDGCEKADEIDTKTSEMCASEKAKLIEEEYAKVYDHYDKLEAKYTSKMQRASANSISKGRLFVLRARAQYIADIFDEARDTLEEVANPDDPKYALTMQLLILEGLLMLLEPIVVLRVRNKDRNMVENILNGVENEYNITTEGKSVEILLDDVNLPLASKGGVILHDPLNRMLVTNTLNARLDTIVHKILPEIRKALWGTKPFRIMEYLPMDAD